MDAVSRDVSRKVDLDPLVARGISEELRFLLDHSPRQMDVAFLGNPSPASQLEELDDDVRVKNEQLQA
jgi:hypothetical protein